VFKRSHQPDWTQQSLFSFWQNRVAPRGNLLCFVMHTGTHRLWVLIVLKGIVIIKKAITQTSDLDLRSCCTINSNSKKRARQFHTNHKDFCSKGQFQSRGTASFLYPDGRTAYHMGRNVHWNGRQIPPQEARATSPSHHYQLTQRNPPSHSRVLLAPIYK